MLASVAVGARRLVADDDASGRELDDVVPEDVLARPLGSGESAGEAVACAEAPDGERGDARSVAAGFGAEVVYAPEGAPAFGDDVALQEFAERHEPGIFRSQ